MLKAVSMSLNWKCQKYLKLGKSLGIIRGVARKWRDWCCKHFNTSTFETGLISPSLNTRLRSVQHVMRIFLCSKQCCKQFSENSSDVREFGVFAPTILFDLWAWKNSYQVKSNDSHWLSNTGNLYLPKNVLTVCCGLKRYPDVWLVSSLLQKLLRTFLLYL